MLLVFQGVGQFCQFDIDRVNKKLKYIGDNTNYQEQELPWIMLADKYNQQGKVMNARQQKIYLEKLGKLGDKEFADLIEAQMSMYGYHLKSCEL